ncbi:DUF1043 family protein [Wenzhouxiangella sp. XN24]|uniref:YhcB family protein n=1 Tax=Wenzhouxiangella sp. XN24 TaxID=2713569 RepID=UPI0013EE1841|nr:DUF1043 family protein [Wenzhouxiangella sp. XN24]NGX14953.1 YhcB family protein [Wenzhouxiangella sp. XN24]
MSTVGWLLVVAVGIALGFSAGRLWPGSAARVTALEKERNEAREDLQNYRQEVGQHFERTAELFDKVTADYRDLYEHLARSERQLGAIRGESAASSLAQPEQRRLAANPAADEDAAPAEDAAPPGDDTAAPAEDAERAGDETAAPAGDAERAGDETAADRADEDDATRRGQ